MTIPGRVSCALGAPIRALAESIGTALPQIHIALHEFLGPRPLQGWALGWVKGQAHRADLGWEWLWWLCNWLLDGCGTLRSRGRILSLGRCCR
jgi:hypothetical protein